MPSSFTAHVFPKIYGGYRRTNSEKVVCHLQAHSLTTETLEDHSQTFQRILSQSSTPQGQSPPSQDQSSTPDDLDATRRYIQDRIQDGDKYIYMVTAIKSVTDAKITFRKASTTSATLSLSAPAAEQSVTHPPAITAGTADAGAGTAADIVCVALASRQSSGTLAYNEMPGTRVVGVQYCKVKLRRRRKEVKLENVRLSDISEVSWEMFIGPKRIATRGEEPVVAYPPSNLLIVAELGGLVGLADARGTDDDAESFDEDNEEVHSIVVDGFEFIFEQFDQ
jgi:hypothetical protein